MSAAKNAGIAIAVVIVLLFVGLIAYGAFLNYHPGGSGSGSGGGAWCQSSPCTLWAANGERYEFPEGAGTHRGWYGGPFVSIGGNVTGVFNVSWVDIDAYAMLTADFQTWQSSAKVTGYLSTESHWCAWSPYDTTGNCTHPLTYSYSFYVPPSDGANVYVVWYATDAGSAQAYFSLTQSVIFTPS